MQIAECRCKHRGAINQNKFWINHSGDIKVLIKWKECSLIFTITSFQFENDQVHFGVALMDLFEAMYKSTVCRYLWFYWRESQSFLICAIIFVNFLSNQGAFWWCKHRDVCETMYKWTVFWDIWKMNNNFIHRLWPGGSKIWPHCSYIALNVSNISARVSIWTVPPIDYRWDDRHFWLSAHDCQVPTPTSQNLNSEQQIQIFEAD